MFFFPKPKISLNPGKTVRVGRICQYSINNVVKGTISKSNLITMGSLHSWPTVLGCLSFLVESAKVHLKVKY